ncbi:MAG: class I SAM-dependent methyltransferase [Candidatus Omnitrophica bacterium]|nr:class I SAM-dependent methyltransferase [Candidatus Omnitrophota bacterium]MDD5552866.1 class I SAM-dependent methyltransferase [Candidatus Omnitrophota bacterium]
MDERKDKILEEVSRYLYKKNPLISRIEKSKHFLAARLCGSSNRIVLDLGCGFGEHFAYHAKNEKAVGIDISMELLRKVEAQYPHGVCGLIQADAAAIPLKDNSVDCIVSLSVLEHIAELDRCLIEARRVLKENGRFVVGLPTDGLLFKIGRELTVKKYISGKFKIDYEELCRKEHVNEIGSVLKKLKAYFRVKTVLGAPFILPSRHLNTFLLYELRK